MVDNIVKWIDDLVDVANKRIVSKNSDEILEEVIEESLETLSKPDSIYVEFDVLVKAVVQGGTEGCGIIPGPGSIYDTLNIQKGLTPIVEMPRAENIKIIGGN